MNSGTNEEHSQAQNKAGSIGRRVWSGNSLGKEISRQYEMEVNEKWIVGSVVLIT